jgi:hypothetical protein
MKICIRLIILACILSVYSILFLSSNALAADATVQSPPSVNAVPVYVKSRSLPAIIKTPSDSGITIYASSPNQSGSVVFKNGFLFYSNNPEYVKGSALADYGHWLNRAEVYGNGQVYIWHNNATYATIKSGLYIINPSKTEDIVIKTDRYALTNGSGVTDIAAWDAFLGDDQTSTSVSLKPGQCVELFQQAIAPNNNFGVIAAIRVTDSAGRPAQAVFEDLAYYYKNTSAADYAEGDWSTTGGRGLGSSYQNTLTFDPLIMSGNNYTALSIAAKDDSFNGTDLVKISDASSRREGLLEGNYGLVTTIIMPITNLYRDNQNFGIFIGSIGGNSYPFVRLQANSFVSSPIKPFTAYNMIQTGKMDLGTTETVSFTLVIPALSSTPLMIGVHPIS